MQAPLVGDFPVSGGIGRKLTAFLPGQSRRDRGYGFRASKYDTLLHFALLHFAFFSPIFYKRS